MTPSDDIIDLALRPGPELKALRDQREAVRLQSQSSHDALLGLPPSRGLSSPERFAVAALVANLHASETLAAHYRERLHALGAEPSTSRLQAMLRHAELLSTDLAQASPAHLAALADAGLDAGEIVTLSQLIGFVAYQARVVAGLGLLQKAVA